MSSLSHPAGITTLHRLSPEAWPALERSLENMTRDCPGTLILPCHVRELGTEALAGIVDELKLIQELLSETDGRAGRKSLALILAIYESARTGRDISIPSV